MHDKKFDDRVAEMVGQAGNESDGKERRRAAKIAPTFPKPGPEIAPKWFPKGLKMAPWSPPGGFPLTSPWGAAGRR